MTHRSAMDSERRNTPPESSVAIVALTRAGGELALELASRFEGSDCFLPAWHGMQGCRSFDRLGDLLPGIWESYDGIVCIMAAGIVVRLIAPLLSHKTVDPAVVVVDENGEYAVSLVSGHLGEPICWRKRWLRRWAAGLSSRRLRMSEANRPSTWSPCRRFRYRKHRDGEANQPSRSRRRSHLDL